MGLFDRAGLPRADFDRLTQALGRRVRVLAWARGADGPVAGLADRLAIGEPSGWRFVGWHEIAAGGWDAETAMLRWRLDDGSEQHARLEDPGSLPELFRERVDASIVVREKVELQRGRTATIVARRRLDGSPSGLLWTVIRQGGSFDADQSAHADGELARLQAEYDIS